LKQTGKLFLLIANPIKQMSEVRNLLSAMVDFINNSPSAK
jgi:hypothetical protein